MILITQSLYDSFVYISLCIALDNSGELINPTAGALYHASVFNWGYSDELSN